MTIRLTNQRSGKRWTSLAPPRCDPDGRWTRVADRLEPRWLVHRFERSFTPIPLPGGKGRERKDDGAMSLFSRLLQAVGSWRRRPGGPKTAKRAVAAIEQLDHRQLLAVNFTGNVPIDFPANQIPGVVLLPDNPSVQHPAIDPAISPLVNVSGL